MVSTRDTFVIIVRLNSMKSPTYGPFRLTKMAISSGSLIVVVISVPTWFQVQGHLRLPTLPPSWASPLLTWRASLDAQLSYRVPLQARGFHLRSGEGRGCEIHLVTRWGPAPRQQEVADEPPEPWRCRRACPHCPSPPPGEAHIGSVRGGAPGRAGGASRPA